MIGFLPEPQMGHVPSLCSFCVQEMHWEFCCVFEQGCVVGVIALLQADSLEGMDFLAVHVYEVVLENA